MPATLTSSRRWARAMASLRTGPRRIRRSVATTGVTSIAHMSTSLGLKSGPKRKRGARADRTPREVRLSGPPFEWAEPEKRFRLFGGVHLVCRDHRHEGAVVALGDELHGARGRGEEGVVAT